MSKTKIVANLGPATFADDQIRKMDQAGVDIFRLNFSHGDRNSHEEMIKKLREIVPHKAILMDSKGPEIRLGKSIHSFDLVKGQEIWLTNEEHTFDLYVDYKPLAQKVYPGYQIVIDSGKILLEVIRVEENRVLTKALMDGKITPMRHVNLPGIETDDLPILTESDVESFTMGFAYNPEYVAISFVRNAEDIKTVRTLLDKHGSKAQIIAKIEYEGAIKKLDEILPLVDGVMIARGDLAVEIPWYTLGIVSQVIVEAARKHGKMIIMATQMLSSMLTNPTPTRAEVTDVTMAVQMGCNVMLSDETAVGKYPIEAVQVLRGMPDGIAWH